MKREIDTGWISPIKDDIGDGGSNGLGDGGGGCLDSGTHI